METTIKDIEKNLETLPKELLNQVNEYVSFLKEISNDTAKIPQWQKDEVARRKYELKLHPENFVNEQEMDSYLKELENES